MLKKGNLRPFDVTQLQKADSLTASTLHPLAARIGRRSTPGPSSSSLKDWCYESKRLAAVVTQSSSV
jgi:hypothetical protein